MSYIRYTYEQLKTFCTDAFQKFGFTADEATRITDVLLLSDVYGIESHGMQRLVRYHKGGTCHGFMAIDPAVFGDAEGMKQRFSTFLQELRDAPKAEGAARIYTHGEKEILAYADRLENGIDVNINTVAEMRDLCEYLGMDSVAYLGDVDFSAAKQSSYK